MPVPDHTNPSAPGYQTQAAVHNNLPVLEEIVGIVEKDEEDAYTKEVAKRRTRLGAASPEQLRKEVGIEVWGPSQVCNTSLASFLDNLTTFKAAKTLRRHPQSPKHAR